MKNWTLCWLLSIALSLDQLIRLYCFKVLLGCPLQHIPLSTYISAIVIVQPSASQQSTSTNCANGSSYITHHKRTYRAQSFRHAVVQVSRPWNDPWLGASGRENNDIFMQSNTFMICHRHFVTFMRLTRQLSQSWCRSQPVVASVSANKHPDSSRKKQ